MNAFTGQDVTAYYLSNVLLIRMTIIDSALLILLDWSSYIAFKDEEMIQLIYLYFNNPRFDESSFNAYMS